MARAFIKRAGGYNCITYETKWADIIPVCPPRGVRASLRADGERGLLLLLLRVTAGRLLAPLGRPGPRPHKLRGLMVPEAVLSLYRLHGHTYHSSRVQLAP